jgi:hypothetical protein
MEELVALARLCTDRHSDENVALIAMRDACGLSKLREGSRQRFLMAMTMAQPTGRTSRKAEGVSQFGSNGPFLRPGLKMSRCRARLRSRIYRHAARSIPRGSERDGTISFSQDRGCSLS